MRVLLFGMRCPFTHAVLERLIAAGHAPTAAILPGRIPGLDWRWLRPPGATRGLPMAGNTSLESLAGAAGIPVAEISRPGLRIAREAIAALDAELVVVACFPWLIPAEIAARPVYGAVNLHPSLLPALRGPDPLFWSFQRGLRESGVTLHRLSERFDAGAILAQQAIEIPPGVRLAAQERVMGQAGGQLLVDAFPRWAALVAAARAQDEAKSTVAPNPSPADVLIETSWPAERAYRFVRGLSGIIEIFEIRDATGKMHRVRDAVEWRDDRAIRASNFTRDAGFALPFADGILRVIPG
jgi:methionyl-tRNA formyltransferase